MTRLARMVIPGLPHHVTQRGNRREAIFFEDGDHEIYCDMLAEQLRKSSVEVRLLPYAEPRAFDFEPAAVGLHGPGLGRSASPIYQLHQCAWPVDRSFVSEPVCPSRHGQVTLEGRALVCQLNPVRARLVSRAEEWAWSSVRAHLAGEDDGLVSVRPVLDRWPNFRDLLLQDYDEAFTSLRKAEGIGRPVGTADFVIELERRLGRPIARRAPGRKATATSEGEQLKLLQ
jgi:putative transposase